jgi:hypothetical protein
MNAHENMGGRERARQGRQGEKRAPFWGERSIRSEKPDPNNRQFLCKAKNFLNFCRPSSLCQL